LRTVSLSTPIAVSGAVFVIASLAAAFAAGMCASACDETCIGLRWWILFLGLPVSLVTVLIDGASATSVFIGGLLVAAQWALFVWVGLALVARRRRPHVPRGFGAT